MGGVQSACGFGGTKPRVAVQNFFQLEASKADGKKFDFGSLKGKVTLVANVASN